MGSLSNNNKTAILLFDEIIAKAEKAKSILCRGKYNYQVADICMTDIPDLCDQISKLYTSWPDCAGISINGLNLMPDLNPNGAVKNGVVIPKGNSVDAFSESNNVMSIAIN